MDFNLDFTTKCQFVYSFFLETSTNCCTPVATASAITTTGVYTVRIVENVAVIAKFSCYKSFDQLIQERSLFVTPKTTTICIGEQIDVPAMGS